MKKNLFITLLFALILSCSVSPKIEYLSDKSVTTDLPEFTEPVNITQTDITDTATMPEDIEFIPNDSNELLGTIAINMNRAAGTPTGQLILIIGNERATLNISNAEIQNGYLVVAFRHFTRQEGILVISYISNIQINGTPLNASGRMTANIQPDVTNNLNDSDGDGTVESSEIASAFQDVDLVDGYTATSEPQILSLTVENNATDVAYTKISGEISNMDTELVSVDVNGISTPIQVTIDSTTGLATFSNVFVALEPGENTLKVVAVNSIGVEESQDETIIYTPDSEANSNQPNILTTLTWDSPTSDMDLHHWYFESKDSFLNGDSATWYNYFGNAVSPISTDLFNFSENSIANISYTLNGSETSNNYSNILVQLHSSYDDDSQMYEYYLYIYGFYNNTINYITRISLLSPDEIDLTSNSSLEGLLIGTQFGTFTLQSGSSINLNASDPQNMSGELTLICSDENNGNLELNINYDNALNLDTYSNNIPRKLDVDDTEGFGPEHFTLNNIEDGYYVIAVNSYDLDQDERTNIFVSVNVGNETKSFGPFRFNESNGMAYPVNDSTTWYRIADILVENGTPTILDPDTTIDPSGSETRSLMRSPIKLRH